MTGNRETFSNSTLRRAPDRAFAVAAGATDPGLLPSVVGAASTFMRTSSAASAPSKPAHPGAAGLPQMALAAFPGVRGLKPLGAFSRGRGVMRSVGGPRRFRGLASPTRARAASDCLAPAFVALPLRRRQTELACLPRQAASSQQHAGGSGGLGRCSDRSRAARRCSISSPVGTHPETDSVTATTDQTPLVARAPGASV